ncbi:MAG: site-specific integrase, partial [Gemmataceae bacterium]|nr:site-specific integrase [Gemmataceae bacterium]MCI0738180.1 site-specific integrase [Gemmataceae bacterium]
SALWAQRGMGGGGGGLVSPFHSVSRRATSQRDGVAEIGAFLEHVAKTEKDALGAIATARAALEFLYERVIHKAGGELPLQRPPRLLDQVKQVLRVKHYALRTEECYVQWIKRFILFNGTRHPRDMGAAELELFLSDLALMARLLYGCGLRLMECCRLRVKDVDLARGQIMVRHAKGGKANSRVDRVRGHELKPHRSPTPRGRTRPFGSHAPAPRPGPSSARPSLRPRS